MQKQIGGCVYLLINTFLYCAVDGVAIRSGYMANFITIPILNKKIAELVDYIMK